MANDSPDRSPLIISALIAAVAVVVLGVAIMSSGGEPEPEPTAQPTATADPAPEPEPEPEPEPPPPVEGEHEVIEVVDLSVTGTGLYRAGTGGDAPVPVDDASVATFAAAMASWIDDHLTALQDGQEGAVVAAGLGGPSEVVHLTDPDHPVTSARYSMRVGARGAAEWGEVEVLVLRDDGTERTATLAFLPGDEAPRLIAAEGDGTAPAPAAADEGTHDDGAGEDADAGEAETEEGS
jgi:hypothetical protein